MRPVISDGTVIPHVSIIRVRSILAVGAIIEDILRHLWRFIAGTGEEALGIVGDDERIAGQAGASWGLLRQPRRPGNPSVLRTFQLNNSGLMRLILFL